jgi:ketosteroid isomerase-like protein
MLFFVAARRDNGMISRGAWVRYFAAFIVVLLVSTAAWGQKKKKNQPADTSPMPDMPMPPAERLDTNIGEMLGAFQAGDIEAMHKYYAENAVFVRASTFEPPLVGWQNYANLVQQQRAAFPGGMQIIRKDTNIFVLGDVGWASYAWQFLAQYQGKPYAARGQTTLVFNKVGESWLIVHNHTSQIPDASMCGQQQPAAPPAQNTPVPAPAPTKP